jgi:A/G-specific adenine glycosylase
VSDFAARLIRWHKRYGRHDLPWQNTTDPYRVWLSEIMLQQTQVATATPYYLRFLECFPTLADLATASVDEVMALWSGLGYYARARNLHACARAVVREHGGKFPGSPEELAALPGIGRSTANSIATFCFGAKAPILDGNVKRVLCRAYGIDGVPTESVVEKQLWALAETLMPMRHGDTYNQAQMDLGATVCTRSKPRCTECPLQDICVACTNGRTDELPARKPSRKTPEREATLLIIRDQQGLVLLEQRPPAGIWGGLQSLPELPAEQNLEHFVSRTLGLSLIAVSPAPTFVHVFSHFRLRITPVVCSVDTGRVTGEATVRWFASEALPGAALPAPVRKLLESLQP